MFTDAASLYVIPAGDGGAPSRVFAFAAQHRNPAEFLILLPTTESTITRANLSKHESFDKE